MSGAGKLGSLLSLLLSDPREFRDRVAMLVDVRLDMLLRSRAPGAVAEWSAALAGLEAASRLPFSGFFLEPAREGFEDEMRKRAGDLPRGAVLSAAHNADLSLGRLCYAACRALEPEVVVETGVAHGVTSAFVLKALDRNGRGTLHSVDLPPLGRGAAALVGGLVPDGLRARWKLHRGVSGRLLPALVADLGSVDVFVHDSLHTYRNMRRELDIVTPRLARPSLVIADDVGGNAAFAHWSASLDPAFRAVLREESKDALCGAVLLW